MKAILLNRILLVLAFVGLFIAGALSIEAATGNIVPCGPAGGCAVVAAHPSSKIGGVPVAYIGFAGYLILAFLAAARAFRGVHANRSLVTAGYVVSAIGVLVSLALQYTSFFIIRAMCLWCLSSAVLMIVTLIVHALLAQELDNHPEAPDRPAGPGPDLPLVAGLPLALGVGLVLVAGSMKPSSQPLPKPSPTISTETLIPEGAHAFGQPTAPLTIVEFADILCPACQRTSPQVKDFVAANPGKVRLIYRHFPLQRIHPQATAAAAIAEVAADEGKFWDFLLAVMGREMKPETPDELFEVASIIGMNTSDARKRLSNENDPIYERIDRDLQAVKAVGITSTPTFFLVHKGKVIDTLGPGQILERLSDPKIQAIMNGQDGS